MFVRPVYHTYLVRSCMLIIRVNQILGLFLLVNLLDHVDPLSVSLSP